MMKKKAKMMKKKPKLSKKPKLTKKPKMAKKPKMVKKPSMVKKPMVQKGRSLKDIQADIERVGKRALQTSDPNERDAAMLKKKILINERNDMIAANKKAKNKNTKDTKPGMMKKPKVMSSGGVTAKGRLEAAKAAKRAPGKAVRDARKALREENKSTRQATRRSNKISRVSSRLKNKQERVARRTNKTRVQTKLDKLNMPTMLKPMMGTGTMKPKIKKPMMMKKPMMGFRKKK